MIKAALFVLAFASPVAGQTQDIALPALHDVTGVAVGDVLNLRVRPDAASPIIGGLAPDFSGVEVVGVSPDGKWARVNQGEMAGWVSMRFLKPQDRPAWFALRQALRCSGTEPFWALSIDPRQQTVRMSAPDQEAHEMDIVASWPGESWRPTAAFQFASETGGGFATVRTNTCSDGMSDIEFGLSIDVFMQGTPTASASAIRGCCSLLP